MQIKKHTNEYDEFDIELLSDNKSLLFERSGQDLTLRCKNTHEFYHITDIAFEITKDNETLFDMFEELYNSLITGNLLGFELLNEVNLDSMRIVRESSLYESIVNAGVITLNCDACPITLPNTLSILNLRDRVRFEFSKKEDIQIMPKLPYEVSTHLRMSGSRSQEFTLPFNRLYKKLQDLDEEGLRLIKC